VLYEPSKGGSRLIRSTTDQLDVYQEIFSGGVECAAKLKRFSVTYMLAALNGKLQVRPVSY
jgi:hypothetical protein